MLEGGAAIAHIHVRNDDGTPSTDFAKYKETIERIRAHKDCDICINITSSGSVDFGDEERIYPLQQLLPELASYDAGTLNWQHRTVFMNPPSFLEKLGHALQESNIKPEIEIFDGGMIQNAIHYIKTGVLKAPCHFQIVLGCAGGLPSTVENLVFLRNMLPEGSTWAACGIGHGHLPIMMATIAMAATCGWAWRTMSTIRGACWLTTTPSSWPVPSACWRRPTWRPPLLTRPGRSMA